MSDLLVHQMKFSRMFCSLLTWLFANGYEVTGGEWQRAPAQAALNAVNGSGIKNSLHILKLAVDLNIFENGKLLETKNDYLPIGEYWEHLGGCWGGRFQNADSDHFSLAYNGVK